MLNLTASPAGPFDINVREGDAGVRFPMPDAAYKAQVNSLDTYLMAMKASMGDVARIYGDLLSDIYRRRRARTEPENLVVNGSFEDDGATVNVSPD